MVLPPTDRMDSLSPPRRVWVKGPIIVGAGPSGLAVAAGLREQDVPVPFVMLERTDCIAPLWQKRTYDRLKLNLPKQFCELPCMPFPKHYPEYPTRQHFIDYLENYAAQFDIKPEFNHTVLSARYDETSGLWLVRAAAAGSEMEYVGRWLVAATGKNAESVVPDIPGLAGFGGEVTHVSQYKSGKSYRGKRVLVVGCGNSGMEVSLDLCDHGALPSMVVRDAWRVHSGEVLDRIMSGDITVVPGVTRFTKGSAELADGQSLDIDAVVLATGYRSNVSEWLQDNDLFNNDGSPKTAYPHGWKGQSGLYAVGFTGLGLWGASTDAVRIAKDLGQVWKETKPTKRAGA